MARRCIGAKKQREVDILALRADPGPAEPALSGGLLLGNSDYAGGLPGRPGLFHPLVGGPGRLPIQYFFIKVIRTLLHEK